jgi:hypothetical protein
MEDEHKNLVAAKKRMDEKEKHPMNEGRLLMSLVKLSSYLTLEEVTSKRCLKTLLWPLQKMC